MSHNNLEYAQYKAQRIKELIPKVNSRNKKLLDFGCGSGLMTYYLQEVFFQTIVIGVDQSGENSTQAKETYSEITFYKIKNDQLFFKDAYFDAIIAADVFHHIPRSMHSYWVKELMRVLKPGGFFILLEPNSWNLFARHTFKNNPKEKNVQMFSFWYSKKLFTQFGKTKIFFCNFFAEKFYFPFWLESLMVKIPLGQIYIFFLQKS